MPIASRNARTARVDTVQLPSGPTVEYMLLSPAHQPSEPQNDTRVATKLAICLHPWSWLGGRMNDPVLQLVTEPLLQAGYHVLRYNSRGVGKSTGRASFTGSSEVEDLKELTQWARSTMPDLTSLVFLGYSYGSLIVSLQPVLASLRTSHVIISYPLAPRSWLTAFRGGRYNAALHDLVRARGANVLVLYGDHDEFTSAASYDAWVNGLRVVNEEGGHSDATLKVVKVEGASHFWREDDAVEGLLDTMSSWLRQ